MKPLPLLLLSLLPLAGLAQRSPARPRQLARPGSVAAAPPLSLQQAITEALQHNYGIQLARQDEQVANNNVTRGNAGQLPSLTGTLTRTFTNNNVNQRFGGNDPRVINSATSNFFNSNLALGWTLFDGLGMFIA